MTDSASGGRRWVLAALGAGLFALSAVAGLYLSSRFGPEQLRLAIERELSNASDAPCRIARLELEPGLPIAIRATQIAMWDGALQVSSATARVSLGAALTGRLHLSRLRIDGALLRLDGSEPWSFASPGQNASTQTPTRAADAVGWSRAGFHALRRWFEEPPLADRIELRGGHIVVSAQRSDPPALEFALAGLRGELVHSALRGDSALDLSGRLHAEEGDLGGFELRLAASQEEPLRAVVATTDLDLAWLAREIFRNSDAAGATLPRGLLSGVAELDTATPGRAALDVDGVVRDFALPRAKGAPLVTLPRVAMQARIEADADRVRVRGARVQSGPVSLALWAALARPIAAGADLDLEVRSADLDFASLDTLFGFFPHADGGRRAPWLETVGQGNLSALHAKAAGSLSAWRDALEGDLSRLRRAPALQARADGLRVRLSEADALEALSFDLAWRDDRMQFTGLRARRAGRPLPRLDLELDGVSRLFSTELEARVASREEIGLAGLPLLLSLFEAQPGSGSVAPHIEIQLDRLEHPALLWPLRDVALGIDPGIEQLEGQLRHAVWGGVGVRGEIEWSAAPQRLSARLTLGPRGKAGAAAPSFESPPVPTSREDPGARIWAEGRFEIGRSVSRSWSHQRLAGHFRAAASRVYFDAVRGALLPAGRVAGHLVLELEDPDAIPYRARFHGSGLEANALFAQTGLGTGLVNGRVDVAGDLQARHVPGQHPLAELDGNMELEATQGSVRGDLPAVLALALAGEGLPFGPRIERIRYERSHAELVFDKGVARSEGLAFDGPDVRLFGSGSLDLGHAPHELDAEVAVFLFRPLDLAIGSIPLLGGLLLGEANNLVAAYFELSGPWNDPTARSRPLRSLSRGPLRVLTGMPDVVRRGMAALGGLGQPSVDEGDAGEESAGPALPPLDPPTPRRVIPPVQEDP